MKDFILRLCLHLYPSASRDQDGRAIVDLAYELSAQSRLVFLREVSGLLQGGIRARGRVLRLYFIGCLQARRSTYFGIAAVMLSVAYLLGASANITQFARGSVSFLGSALLAANWLLQVCGLLLLAFGFAVMAAAFIGLVDARDSRLRRGALILAGGYGLILVGGALSLLYYYRSPDRAILQTSMILAVAAYLPAVVAALLAASAFARPRSTPGIRTVARNRRLGWASIGFGAEFALFLLSRLVADSPLWAWNMAYLAAVAAAVVAAAGFFGAARVYRLSSPGPLPRREGVLAMAAVLFLLYRVLELTYLGSVASWLWQLESVVLAVAPLFVTVGLVVSRQSLLSRDHPSLVTGDN